MSYETILVENPVAGVGLVRLNRPEARNALNALLVDELFTALEEYEVDDTIGCMVITGDARAFAAGADIKYFAERNALDLMADDEITDWGRFHALTKPVIAAVQGYALGGGCELALACDMIVAGEGAHFGQPELGIGIIPGAGGTQRLVRAVGKVVAMEMILAGRQLTAAEALTAGLVNRVVPDDATVGAAAEIAATVAAMPRVAVRLAKDAVNKAFELSLQDGLAYEKRNFYLAFATEDKAEGMDAFINKRKPEWKHR